MIIHEPEIRSGPDQIIISANIEFEKSNSRFPDTLWFRFPNTQSDLVSDRCDGFLVAMLLLAMQYRENILVHGPVSPRLLAGIDEYQRVFNMWFPKLFQPVEIACESISPPEPEPVPASRICAFSGGVDSFFSLRNHLDNSREYQNITHLFFMHGFDIELSSEQSYRTLEQAYAQLSKSLGIRLLTGSTNFQEFGTRSEWGLFHGTAMIGAAHVLGRSVDRFYIPASHCYNNLVPWGTDPRIDYLLSSEVLDIIHDGAAYTRVAKTNAISGWPLTFDNLRVCIYGEGLNNCSRCEKCVRTMVTLDMSGALENYATFQGPLRMGRVRRCRYHTASDFEFAREIIREAWKRRRMDIVTNMSWAILASHTLRILRKMEIQLARVKKKMRTPKGSENNFR